MNNMMIIVCAVIALVVGGIHKSEAGHDFENEMDCLGLCTEDPGPFFCISHPKSRSFRARPCSWDCFKKFKVGKD